MPTPQHKQKKKAKTCLAIDFPTHSATNTNHLLFSGWKEFCCCCIVTSVFPLGKPCSLAVPRRRSHFPSVAGGRRHGCLPRAGRRRPAKHRRASLEQGLLRPPAALTADQTAAPESHSVVLPSAPITPKNQLQDSKSCAPRTPRGKTHHGVFEELIFGIILPE